MKTYVKIDADELIEVVGTGDIKERFDTISDAVQYADEHFNEDMDSFEVYVYNADTDICVDSQTVKRNPYSGDFVYAAWGFGVSKWNDDEWDWYGDVFDTLDQLLENEDYLSVKENGYGLRVEKYTQTVDENIGDVVDTYEED